MNGTVHSAVDEATSLALTANAQGGQARTPCPHPRISQLPFSSPLIHSPTCSQELSKARQGPSVVAPPIQDKTQFLYISPNMARWTRPLKTELGLPLQPTSPQLSLTRSILWPHSHPAFSPQSHCTLCSLCLTCSSLHLTSTLYPATSPCQCYLQLILRSKLR